MTELFGRVVECVVGTRRFSGFEISFDVQRTLSADPDQAEVSIYNLAADDRKAVEAAGRNAQVVLYAGYRSADEVPSIFKGRWRRAITERQGADLVTKVEFASAYSARDYSKQLNKGYRAGTALRTVINDCLAAINLDSGNLRKKLNSIGFNGQTKLAAPFSVHGPAWDTLVNIMQSAGLDITTQNEELVVLGQGQGFDQRATVLQERTGLVGQPTVDQDGVLTATSLIIPGLYPGRLVQISSELVNGQFRVETANYRGSLYSNEFYVTIEGRIPA